MYGILIILYGMYAQHITGSGDFILLSGEDFNILDGTTFLLLT